MWWYCIILWTKVESFEAYFDSIWLSPAVSHSLLCGGSRRDVYITFCTLQTFHFSETEGLHPVHSRGNSMYPSIVPWATLIFILHPKDKPLCPTKDNQPQMAEEIKSRLSPFLFRCVPDPHWVHTVLLWSQWAWYGYKKVHSDFSIYISHINSVSNPENCSLV